MLVVVVILIGSVMLTQLVRRTLLDGRQASDNLLQLQTQELADAARGLAVAVGIARLSHGAQGLGIAQQLGLDRDQCAVAPGSGLDPDHGCVPLGMGEHRFRARVENLDRSSAPFGQQGGVDAVPGHVGDQDAGALTKLLQVPGHFLPAPGIGRQLGAEIGQRVFSVEQEEEADFLAAHILYRAGYDLDVARQMLLKIGTKSDKGESSFLSTHPSGPERLAGFDKTIALVREDGDGLPGEELLAQDRSQPGDEAKDSQDDAAGEDPAPFDPEECRIYLPEENLCIR